MERESQRLSAQEAGVGRHYDEAILIYEIDRLPTHSPVEFAVTCRYLRRYIDSGSTVAEVGVGGGGYSELLARHGCSLHLVDVSRQLLAAAETRLRAVGLDSRVLDSTHASATALTHLAAASCDAVVFLGPLYHLCALADRQNAVREAARVLTPGGLLFAAGINRLAYLRDAFRGVPDGVRGDPAFRSRFMADGNLDPEHAPPLGYAHLTTSEEFRALFEGVFTEVALVGVDTFANVWQEELGRLPVEDREPWLDLIEQTGRTPDGLGASDHFLYIGRAHGSSG